MEEGSIGRDQDPSLDLLETFMITEPQVVSQTGELEVDVQQVIRFRQKHVLLVSRWRPPQRRRTNCVQFSYNSGM